MSACKCLTGFEPCCGRHDGTVRFTLTYDIVTAESADFCDTSEAGFVDADGEVLPFKTADGGYRPLGEINEIRERENLEHEMTVDEFVAFVQDINQGRNPVQSSSSDLQDGTRISVVNENDGYSDIPGPLAGATGEDVLSVTYSLHFHDSVPMAVRRRIVDMLGVNVR